MKNKLFRKIFIGFILMMSGIQFGWAGAVLTTKTDNGSVINLTDSKPCYADGEIQPNTAIAFIIFHDSGQMHSGCWYMDNSTNNVVINWGPAGYFSYSINGFDFTEYGRKNYLNK